jgi:hypothetical protein
MGYIKFHLQTTNFILKSSQPPFNEYASKAILTANLLTDVYMAIPSFLRRGPSARLALNFHFDNLFSFQEIKNYRSNLEEKTKILTQEITYGLKYMRNANEKNSLLFLFLIGTTMHAIQDFYCHSNWIELWDRFSNNNVFPAWHEAPQEEKFLAELLTGKYKVRYFPPHAIEHADMNLDFPRRGKSRISARNGKTYYEIAKELAEKESAGWLNNFSGWVKETELWQNLTNGFYLNEKMLRAIAAEYKQIKRLFLSAESLSLQTLFSYLSCRNNFSGLMRELWNKF